MLTLGFHISQSEKDMTVKQGHYTSHKYKK